MKGSAGRRRADPAAAAPADLADAILRLVEEHREVSARQLLAILRRAGEATITKSDVNAILYRAMNAGLVVKEDGTPPAWRPAGDDTAVEPTGRTSLERIIDLYLEVSGERWSPAQRAAASRGPSVGRFVGFDEGDLEQALRAVPRDRLSWDAWYDAVVDLRSGGIRLS